MQKNKTDKQTLKWLYKRSKGQILPLVFLIVLYSVLAILSVLGAIAAKGIVEGAIEFNGNWHKIIKYSIFLISTILGQFAFKIISKILEEKIKAKLEIAYKSNLFSAIFYKDYQSLTKIHSGDLLNRIFSDVTVVSEGVTTILPELVSMITRLVAAFAILITLDLYFSLVFLVGGVAVFLLVRSFKKLMKRLHKEVQSTEGKTRSFMQEAIENLLAVKAFCAQKIITKKADDLQQINYKAKMKRRKISVVSNAGFNLAFQAGYAYALVWGAFKIIKNGPVFAGTLTAVLDLVNQVQAPFANISGLVPRYYGVIASCERIIEIETISNEDFEQIESYNPFEDYKKLESISFENIDFSYGREKIFDDTSITINKGDFVAITGISGIGKSTLLRLLLCVYSLDDGKINLNLTDGKKEVKASMRKLFAYVPQGNMLFSGTIRENITFIKPDATDEEIDFALKMSCADEFVSSLKDGLETTVGEKGLGLSEGQIQRLAIARAIICQSPILLLDEATSALDSKTEKRLLDNVKNMSDKTCIIISHKAAAVECCNMNICIENKKIVKIG